MARVVAVSAEGVLCRPQGASQPFGAYQPIAEGTRLVAALSEVYQVAVVTSSTDKDAVDTWMTAQGMADYYAYVVVRQPGFLGIADEVDLRVAQWDFLRGTHGFAVEFVLDANPAVVQRAVAKGFNALLFTHPAYARPEWRPDDERGLRAWGEIEAEVQRQVEARVADKRLVDVGDGRFER